MKPMTRGEANRGTTRPGITRAAPRDTCARGTAMLRAAVAAACVAMAAGRADAAPQQDDIAELSLEQLSDIVITSVSRQEERLGNAAASIYIISNNDIRRSGARSLPEALRLAPNLQVARADARNYAVTARGFNSLQSNKLLVLIDGRNVYTPLFSGVQWDAQDVLLEDVERIEVISGPGGTIWGANAVNGVINVITRSAKDTQGTLVTAAASSEDREGSVRYGGALPNDGHYRIYARYVDADDAARDTGLAATGLTRRQAGFRADWDRPRGGFTLSGDVYQGELAQRTGSPIRISGANLVTRLTRRLADDSNVRLQLVLDHVERDQPNTLYERLDTVELEAQHGVRLGTSHNVTWGAGYRYSRDRIANGRNQAYLPNDLSMHWASLFAQDEVALREDLRLTVGIKAEHNQYTGGEFLPGLRLAWTPDSRQLLWASLARTVRTPSRYDRDLYTPLRPVAVGGVPRYIFGGGPAFESETANVAELGYRIQPSPRWSYSATAFFASYDKLRTQEPNPRGPAYSGLSEVRNMAYGRTRGIEMWARWQATDNWRLSGGLVVQRVDTALRPGSRDGSGAFGVATADPGHYWQLRSSHDLPGDMQLDWTLRKVGALPRPAVPSYHELDLQWLWKATRNLDVALIGQNLLHRSHPEFGAAPNRSVFERTAVLRLTYRF
ncbi:TonB-dependent receptor [Massilia dura]|uniref:TonB-dependent receptor n=1 Tax=Pseudoduganella dura TaxID=321982 RepID=A0A6I3X7C4_9BURK|nr:TonB-dependent receptor [Pseudoduganella dura]MUI11656.1 TonB-dependent receptor [Pseudoduganella dura]